MPLGSADGEPALYCGFVEGAAHVITTEFIRDVLFFIISQVPSFSLIFCKPIEYLLIMCKVEGFVGYSGLWVQLGCLGVAG